MKTYWPFLRDRVKYLHGEGVRGVWMHASTNRKGERRVFWEAWGLDGLPADWRELGLHKDLDDLVHEVLAQGQKDYMILYIYPMGYMLKGRKIGEDWELVERRFTSGRKPVEPRHGSWEYWPWEDSLRKRLERLVASYPTWYNEKAPEEWREAHGPEPTPENIFELGRAIEEWSVLEEPLVPGLLREILGKE